MDTPGEQSNPRLEGELRLAEELENFRQLLSPAERAGLTSVYPDVTSVAALTRELNNIKSKKVMKLGEKFRPFLQFVQEFSPVVEVYIQGDPNQIAPLVWGSVKFVIQVRIML